MPDITWLGNAAFRIRGKDATIIADPFDKGNGLEVPRGRADIVTVSRDDPNHNAIDNIKGEPHVLRGPGEYEVRGVFINGVGTYADAKKGALRGKNTAFVFEVDGVVICHLGSLGHTLSAAQVEALSNVNVLLVPVGSPDALDPAHAVEVIAQIEPPYVVPMMYKSGPEGGNLEPIDRFAREMGLKEWKAEDKLVIKGGEYPETTQVVVLAVKS
ncbi:MAG TPA: MBL fold metallo-hydrolase [Chloroflexia bacterium]|nr:MBL fold metallo-hydrolase [Chloroflexia bacterium]